MQTWRELYKLGKKKEEQYDLCLLEIDRDIRRHYLPIIREDVYRTQLEQLLRGRVQKLKDALEDLSQTERAQLRDGLGSLLDE